MDSSSSSSSSPKPTGCYPKIILFGDSLTERSYSTQNHGFGAVLQDYYARKADVLSRGVSGYNTRWMRKPFENIISALKAEGSKPPLLFTIFLGANDAVPPGYSQHVPLEEFETHLRYYVDTLLNNEVTKGTKIILISPPPIDVLSPSFNRSVQLLQREYENKKLYAAKVMEVANSYKKRGDPVEGLDFWTAMINYGLEMGKKQNILEDKGRLPGSGLPGAVEFGTSVLGDGLHLGPDGYDVLSHELKSLITTKWPELRRMNAPWWGHLPDARDSEEVKGRMETRNEGGDGVIPPKWLR
ncbi:MAG: hypothetical protein M1840_000726 [Geoglossum simile]|nr:MAG: hypothetical protein M1840_000726 [Geoglossum simile]